jgi:hypothetical protein
MNKMIIGGCGIAIAIALALTEYLDWPGYINYIAAGFLLIKGVMVMMMDGDSSSAAEMQKPMTK